MEEGRIRVTIVAGSVRPGNFTGKALSLVEDELSKHEDVVVDTVDLNDYELPLPGNPTTAEVSDLQKRFTAATGVVLATPEYHGSYSSVVKLLIDNLGFPSVLAGKPIGLLGVAAGQIGAIKALEHLRSVCSHVGGLVLPGPVSVAGVQKLFDEQGRCLDESTERRVRGLATALYDYIRGSICPRMALEEAARRGELSWMRHMKAAKGD